MMIYAADDFGTINRHMLRLRSPSNTLDDDVDAEWFIDTYVYIRPISDKAKQVLKKGFYNTAVYYPFCRQIPDCYPFNCADIMDGWADWKFREISLP
jgi:hypothetical protein